jgi:DNA-binding CsgD family transcriptional regulator
MAARAAVAAGRWAAARNHLDAAAVHSDRSGDRALAARVTTLRAEVALVQGDLDTATRLAGEAASAAAGLAPAEVACEALELVGRAARGRDACAARAAFTQLLQRAECGGSTVWTTRALYQLGTLDLLERFDTDRLVRARDRAKRVGAIALVAELELEIAAGLQGAFRLDEARAAAAACVETTELAGMRPLAGKAWIFQGVIAAQAGDRRTMERFCRIPLDRDGGPETEGAVWGDCRGVASLAAEKRDRALDELGRAAGIYGGTLAAIPRPAMALHQLVGAVADDPPPAPPDWGATAQLCIAGGFLRLAEAVRAGRRGDHSAAAVAARAGDRLLVPAPWHRHLGRRLAAEAALADGWGDPVPWLSEAADFFDGSGNAPAATACRGLLRRSGQGVGRTRARAALPHRLRQAGVTTREAEVLRLLGEGGSNSAIAERLVLSRRTVEHHVASLLRKLDCASRTELLAAVHRNEDAASATETWVRAPMSR